jgi:antitoxin component of MazEF toxin-antitoxin module
MSAVGRVIKVGTSLYLSLPREILKQCPLKRNDRVAMLTDGRTIAFARIDMHDIVNKALLKQAVNGAAHE